ncbi:hypothetical protein HAZT_HAZT003473 [Hyalella azteca]|uniref:Uncharacterized protein n=1 Tax=Hyalella azteca TaxID=294128 RepID=A0A6A0GYC1_HYAAZ|nr:hypothetical protein HAZT_HAZT003473 [Hyalella azteca]
MSKRCDTMGGAPLKRDGLMYGGGRAKAGILDDQFCNAFAKEDLSRLPTLGHSPHPNIPDTSVATTGVGKLLSQLRCSVNITPLAKESQYEQDLE